jgi:hypothetical protein
MLICSSAARRVGRLDKGEGNQLGLGMAPVAVVFGYLA